MDQTPIRIGLVSGFTGQHADLTKGQHMGVTLAIEELNASGGINGHPLELKTYDDQAKPAEATRITEAMVAGKEVDLVLGTLSSATILEVSRIAAGAGLPVMGICQSKLLTNSSHLNPLTFHESFTPHMTAQLIAKWGTKALGKKWYLLSYEFEFGHNIVDMLTEVLPQFGGEIIGTTFVPIGAGEEGYTKAIEAIKLLKPDVVSITNFGPDQIACMRAAHTAGLTKETCVIHTLSDTYIIDLIGLEYLVGAYFACNFYWKLGEQISSARNFVEAYRKRFDAIPSGYAGYGYSGMMELGEALRATGYPVDPHAITTFLEGRSYDNYKGKQWWRPCDHQSFQNLYIVRFKGPNESTEKYDIGEIVDTVTWDLDIEYTCVHLGHTTRFGGWEERGKEPEFQ